MTSKETVSLFMENAAKVNAEPVHVAGVSEMNQAIGKITENEAAIFYSNQTELEKAVQVDPTRSVESFYDASVAVEECFGAIAETGSIIVTSANGRTVQSSLLPAHHVALLSTDNIFGTLDDFFTAMAKKPPTNITFITGPSRTADIELTLTIGVHGPGRVSVVIV